MAEIIFIYNGNKTNIQCNLDDKMKEICQKFAIKTQNDINIIYFIYNGNIINENLTFSEHINEEDKKKNIMNILVYDNENKKIRECLFKSKEIICPICKENNLININDYKINLYGCKYKHNIRNILLKDYENTQKIDISKIICDKCKLVNKSNTYNNELYICLIVILIYIHYAN